MTLRRLTPGETLAGIPAATWNAFCDAAAAAPYGWTKYGAGERGRALVLLALPAAAAPGDALYLGESLFADDPGGAAAPLASGMVEGLPALAGVALADGGEGDPWGVLLQGGAEGDLALAVVAGVAATRLTVAADDDVWCAPDPGTGAVASGPARPGAARVLWKETGTGAGKWAVVLFHPAPVQNQAAEEEKTYAIDRTDPSQDAKAWDPAEDEPANWKDYEAVELTTATLRFDDSGDPELAKVKRTWAAANAPVIPALTEAEVTDPSEEFACED